MRRRIAAIEKENGLTWLLVSGDFQAGQEIRVIDKGSQPQPAIVCRATNDAEQLTALFGASVQAGRTAIAVTPDATDLRPGYWLATPEEFPDAPTGDRATGPRILSLTATRLEYFIEHRRPPRVTGVYGQFQDDGYPIGYRCPMNTSEPFLEYNPWNCCRAIMVRVAGKVAVRLYAEVRVGATTYYDDDIHSNVELGCDVVTLRVDRIRRHDRYFRHFGAIILPHEEVCQFSYYYRPPGS